MLQFTVKVGNQKVQDSEMIGMLNIRSVKGWCQKVGKIPDKDFKAICQAIEKYVDEH